MTNDVSRVNAAIRRKPAIKAAQQELQQQHVSKTTPKTHCLSVCLSVCLSGWLSTSTTTVGNCKEVGGIRAWRGVGGMYMYVAVRT
jgi:hypothetical protein